MIAKRFFICLCALALAACQSQTPADAPKAGPEAPAEAPKAAPEKAAAPTAAPTPAVDEAPAPFVGVPSDLAGHVVPANVDWFGAVDLRGLKGTIVDRQFRPWLGYLDTIPDYKIVMEATGAGAPLDHAMVVGGTFAPHTKMGFDVVGAVFGLKDETKMSGWVGARIAEEGPPPLREFKLGTKDGVAAWMAGPSLTADVEALLAGSGKSVNDDDAWVELQRAIDTKAPLWALVKIPELIRAQFPLLHREIPGLRFFPGVTEFLGMTHAGMSLDLGDRLALRVAIRLQSAEDAAIVLEQLTLGAEATLWDPSLFFDVFELQTQGPMVILAAATSEKAWRISVFWLSIAAQVAAYEEMHVSRWEAEMMREEKAMMKEKQDEMRAMEEAMQAKKEAMEKATAEAAAAKAAAEAAAAKAAAEAEAAATNPTEVSP